MLQWCQIRKFHFIYGACYYVPNIIYAQVVDSILSHNIIGGSNHTSHIW
jgi:hypothetical protein